MLWPIAYVTNVEQHRAGIQMVELTPYGSDGRFPETALAYIQANINQRPIYINRLDRELRQMYNFKLVDASTQLYELEKQ